MKLGPVQDENRVFSGIKIILDQKAYKNLPNSGPESFCALFEETCLC